MRTHVEGMESRRLLSGTVSGAVFNDANNNRVQDAGEGADSGAGLTAYLDLNHNQQRDANEPAAAAAGGHYAITGVAAGAYDLRLETDYVSATAFGASVRVVVTDGTATPAALPVQRLTPASGYVFLDSNQDGRRSAGESAFAGVQVYADLNHNGAYDASEPQTLTGIGTGQWTLYLPDGTYTVAVNPAYQPASVDATYALTGRTAVTGTTVSTTDPFAASGAVTVAAAAPPAAAYDFGFYKPSVITARVFTDTDADYAKDGSESASGAAQTVYIDRNLNGRLDAGEPSRVTVSGTATFDVDQGVFVLRVVPEAGYAVTAGTGGVAVYTYLTPGTYAAAFGVVTAPAGTARLPGSVYNDGNANGVRDGGEPLYTTSGTPVTAYLDLNGNNALDASEPTARAINGTFAFNDLAPGPYAVRLSNVAALGQFETSPGGDNGGFVATLAAGQTATAAFGLQQAYTVQGNAYQDSDNDQFFDENEPYYTGRTVYDDANDNGLFDPGEPSTLTGAYGHYALRLPAGTHVLREVLPSGYVETSVLSNGAPVGTAAFTIRAGGPTSYAVDFASQPAGVPLRGKISGTLFVDANANGVRDAGEAAFDPALSGAHVTAYLDLNGNRVRDTDEPSGDVDAAGAFGFSGVAPGTYTLRLTGDSGAAALQTGGQNVVVTAAQTTATVVGLAMPYTVYVYAYADQDADGQFDSGDTGLSGRTVYADLNDNGQADPGEPTADTTAGQSVQFLLPSGTYVLREAPWNGERRTGQSLVDAPASSTFSADATLRLPADFNGHTGQAVWFGSRADASVTAHVFDDVNGNGVQDRGETEALAGGFVYADLNNDGLYDGNDLSILPPSNGNSYGLALPPGTYTFRQSLSAGWSQTSPAGARTVVIGATTDAVTVTFARRQTPVATGASTTGTVYNDANKNAKQDSGEAGLSGLTVYVDANNNSKLDAAERSTITGANGAFTLTGLSNTGTSTRLRVILPSGATQITPSNGYGYSLTLTTGATNSGKTFGLYTGTTPPPTTATLSGFTFDDTNKDGVYESTETKTSGKTVFLDANNNGKLDSGEKSMTTGTGGVFTFSGLAAGTYHVRRVFPSGYSQSTAWLDVTLASGAARTGLALGSRRI